MTEHYTRDAFTGIPDTTELARPKERHDGWSPERQVVFLEALARTGNVKAAAFYTGLSRESAYKLRRRPDARAFALAWDAAIIHARDLFHDELMERGLNGWTEAVWHQGEEVGTRERWSAPLFLAALGRLDRIADSPAMASNPARAAAANFDELLDGIGAGDDCADLVQEIDATGDSSAPPSRSITSRSNEELMEMLALREGYEAINAAAPEDIDVSDLDVTDHENWSDLDWERASRSGLLRQSGIWEEDEQLDDDLAGEWEESAAGGE